MNCFGSLHILPGSHTLCHNIKINRNELAARKNSALYFEIDNFYNTYGESLSEKRLNLSFGQGVVFHSNLLHKSGENLSNSTRFAAQSRWFDTTANDAIKLECKGGVDEGVDPSVYIN